MEKTTTKIGKYKGMEESVREIKGPILTIVGLGIIVQLVLLSLALATKKEDARKFSILEACYYGMDSLFNHAPHEGLLHKSVIKDVKGHKFFIHEVTQVKVIDKYHCEVLARGKEDRRYLVKLDFSSKFSHFYRILDVKGERALK